MTDLNTEETLEVEDQPLNTTDDVFSDEPEKEKSPKVETEETEKSETDNSESAETTETETEKEEKSETEEKVEPTATDENTKTVPIAALQDERANTTKARERAEALQKELDSIKAEKQTIPDPIEDPEGYQAYQENKSASDSLALKKTLSRNLMMELKEDFPDMEKVFISEIAKVDPETGAIGNEHIVLMMNASDNPAKFVYEQAKDHLKVKELTNPNYETNLKEKLKAEILEELKNDKNKPKSATELPDLTKAAAAGTNTERRETMDNSTTDEVFSDLEV